MDITHATIGGVDFTVNFDNMTVTIPMNTLEIRNGVIIEAKNLKVTYGNNVLLIESNGETHRFVKFMDVTSDDQAPSVQGHFHQPRPSYITPPKGKVLYHTGETDTGGADFIPSQATGGVPIEDLEGKPGDEKVWRNKYYPNGFTINGFTYIYDRQVNGRHRYALQY